MLYVTKKRTAYSRLYNEMALPPPHGRSSRRLQVLAHFSEDVLCADSALSTPG